jgi:DNA invertase Pin-like site-specific DNA recombinase
MEKISVIYIRVSTMQQSINGYSLETQESELKKYAELKQLKNVLVLADNTSGKNIKDRKAFNKLIELIEADKVNNVLVYSLSRFARSLKDTITVIELLNKHNVNFISLSENIDLSTSAGRFFINILASLSQMERENISEKTKQVLQQMKSNGKRVGKLPFGYDCNKQGYLIRNKTEYYTIQLCHRLRNDGYTYQAIADELIKRGRKNKAGNVKWNKGMVYKLLNKQ